MTGFKPYRENGRVLARPATFHEYVKLRGFGPTDSFEKADGYLLQWPDGELTWLSKATFEAGWEAEQPAKELTEAQLDAAVEAWFNTAQECRFNRYNESYRIRMRAAIAALTSKE